MGLREIREHLTLWSAGVEGFAKIPELVEIFRHLNKKLPLHILPHITALLIKLSTVHKAVRQSIEKLAIESQY